VPEDRKILIARAALMRATQRREPEAIRAARSAYLEARADYIERQVLKLRAEAEALRSP
jgi:hypothetical protein